MAEEEERQKEAKEKEKRMRPILEAVVAQNLAKEGKVKATKAKGKK